VVYKMPIVKHCVFLVCDDVSWVETYWSAHLTKYYSGDKNEKNEMDGARSTYGERRGTYRVLVGKPEGMIPLGRPRRILEDNINMELQGVEWEGDWMD
jgi:hypothetical protein